MTRKTALAQLASYQRELELLHAIAEPENVWAYARFMFGLQRRIEALRATLTGPDDRLPAAQPEPAVLLETSDAALLSREEAEAQAERPPKLVVRAASRWPTLARPACLAVGCP